MGINYNTSIVRDGLAVYLDAANPKSYSVNVHPNPTDIFAWSGTGSYHATLSRDNITSPVGTTPLKMVVSGNDPYTASYNNSSWNLAPAASGQTWTVSFWVKASTATTGSVYIFGSTAGGAYTEVPGTTYNISTDWQRVSYTGTLSNASTTNVQIRVGGPSTGGSGVSVWWDGLQLERSSSISNFNTKTNSSGDQWFDISGNNNHHTLINMPTFSNNRFTLNETQGFVYNSGSYAGLNPEKTATVCLWYSTTDTQELWARGNNDTSFYLSASWGNNYYHNNCGSPTNYVDLVSTVNPATPINYRDGTMRFWEAKNVNFSTWTSYQWFLYSGSWNIIGNVSAVLVYNRALTSTESSQIFAAFRDRYNR